MSIALLIVGSAIALNSCDGEAEVDDRSDETLMTEASENLTVLMSENGRKSYHFTTPLVEGYGLAKEPYREFRKGVNIITYQTDSLTKKDATLTSNYAIYYEKRKLWEAKGNVVVVKEDGKTLYTQQLFWNSTTKKIYSNVDTKIVETNGDVYFGEGFESDESFNQWQFRRMKGRMTVDITPTDSTTTDEAVQPMPTAASAPQSSMITSQPTAPTSVTQKSAESRRTEGKRPESERAAKRGEPLPIQKKM